MALNEERLCRLCLNVANFDFQTMGEVAPEMFDVLPLKMDLSLSNDPVMCRDCSCSIRKFFKFKSMCSQADEDVVSSTKTLDSPRLDSAEEVYLNEDQKSDTVPNPNYDICRLCMKHVQCIPLGILHDEFVNEVVPKCVPNIDIKLAKKPMICEACVESLNEYYSFMMNCLDVEDQIEEYCKSEGIESKQVDLFKLQKFISNVSDYIDEQVSEAVIKTEFEDNTSECPVKLENELIIKDEDPTTEYEQDINNRFSDKPDEDIEYDVIYHTPKEKMYKCKRCPYTTKYRYLLKQHFLRHVDPSRRPTFNCDKCTFTTRYKNYLKYHSQIHLNPLQGETFKCSSCSYEAKHLTGLKKHMKMHNASTVIYQCKLCGHNAVHKSSFNRHMLSHSDPSQTELYKCDKCTFVTKYKNNLKNHLQTHPDPYEQQVFKCPSCSYEAKRMTSLKYHMKIHDSSMIVHKCNLCTYTTVDKSSFKKHALVHKDSSQTELFKCDRCTFVTKYKSYLKNHLQTHPDPNQEQIFKCTSCSYEVNRITSFKNHMKLHKSSTVFHQCELCDYTTVEKSNFKRHLSTHTDPPRMSQKQVPKNFKCHRCEFATGYKVNLKKHLLTHLDPSQRETFKCPLCPAELRAETTLKRHMKVLHPSVTAD